MSRLTMRDVFWLAALALVVLCWLLDHENLTRDNQVRLEQATAAWSEATSKEFDQIKAKMDYITGKVVEKYGDPETTPAE